MDLFKLPKKSASLETADAARDVGDWARAQKEYGAFLEGSPGRHDIWVQLGHARKELGDVVGAEEAYRKSLDLNADVADTHLQLGHALKLLGRQDDAIEAYARAAELDPKLGAARRELRAFGIEGVQRTSSAPRILIDLSDVFFYLRHHSTVSGIQRVQLGLAKALAKLKPADAEVVFLTECEDHSGYVEVERRRISSLITLLNRPKTGLIDLQIFARETSSEGLHYSPVAGDLLLVLGAFWVLPNIIEQIISLKAHGVRVGVMVHDIIPITHPEFCERALTDSFSLYIRSVLRIVDLIISISEHTQAEVRKILEREQISFPDMFVLRNAHLSWEVHRCHQAVTPSSDVAEVLQTKYVLYVSTIEIRKNHTLLFRLWKELLKEIGAAVPRLVFVGRLGWRVRDLMDQISGTDYLNGYISILHDISDTELELLYRNAQFTAFPSFEEGWGLPVGESLIFGRPCVASNTSSIPEVGGGFVDYFNPHDLSDALGIFRRLILDKQYLEERAKAIAEGFRPRTWNDVANELLAEAGKYVGIAATTDGNQSPSLAPVLGPGHLYRVGYGDDQSQYINFGLGSIVHFLFDSHWYPVEDFGRWLISGNGSFSFAVPPGSHGVVRVVLTLCAVDWLDNLAVQIFAAGKPLKIFVPERGSKTTVMFDADASSGELTVKLLVKGLVEPGPDPRKDLSIGVVSLGYAGLEDVSGRLSLVEEMLQDGPGVLRLHQRNSSN